MINISSSQLILETSFETDFHILNPKILFMGLKIHKPGLLAYCQLNIALMRSCCLFLHPDYLNIPNDLNTQLRYLLDAQRNQ